MPWVEQLADPQELRRCIRDLVALSTLPAIWKNYGPHQIADSVTAAFLSMLGADFIYIALPGRPDEPRIEVTHVGRKVSPESVGALQAVLRQAPLGRLEQTAVIADPLGNGQMRVATAPIGFRGDAILIAGSFQADFPTERKGFSSVSAQVTRPLHCSDCRLRGTNGASSAWSNVTADFIGSPAWTAARST
jgi:hypothetical protein